MAFAQPQQKLGLDEVAIDILEPQAGGLALGGLISQHAEAAYEREQEHGGQCDRCRAAEAGMSPRPLAQPFAQAGLRAMFHRQVIEEPAQVFGQVTGRGESPVWVRVQALSDQRVETPGDLGTQSAQRGHWRAATIRHSEANRLSLRQTCGRLREGRAAGDHLEQDQPERIEIRPLVNVADAGRTLRVERIEVLGRHVGKGPAQQCLVGLLARNRAGAPSRRQG